MRAQNKRSYREIGGRKDTPGEMLRSVSKIANGSCSLWVGLGFNGRGEDGSLRLGPDGAKSGAD